MDRLPAIFTQLSDHRVKVRFVIEVLASGHYGPVGDPQLLINEGIAHFKHFNDSELECEFAI
jgi:hypothetical protein